MINVENTENLIGVTISGSYDDLYETYEAIENLVMLD